MLRVKTRGFSVRAVGYRIFNLTTLAMALVILALLAGLTVELFRHALPAIKAFGFGFLTSTDWDPTTDQYGALPFIYGAAVSSALALLIAVPLAFGVALCLSEMAPEWLSRKIGFLVELLAAIPSVVYGLWGIFAAGPWLRDHLDPLLAKYLGFLPLFQPISSLTMQVYTYAISPFADWQRQAWAGALVLTVIVLALEFGVRWLTRGAAQVAR